MTEIIRNTLFIGCGGFTAFSTFSKEALIMLQTGNHMGNAGISVLAGIVLVAAGYFLAR